MPGMSGLGLHQDLVTSGHHIPTILITAYPNEHVREHAFKAGVIGYLSKPFSVHDLLSCIRSGLAHGSQGG